jgi:hypothetical protein
MNGDGGYGCEYCRDKVNDLIDGLAHNNQENELLMECPRCGQYYSWYTFDPHPRVPLSNEEATALFAEAFHSGRPDGSLKGCSNRPASVPTSLSSEWRTDTAIALARTMYEAREFSAMPILADALQDAGCDNDDILNHCRGDGPHVRGCWVCDLVLGKE